MAARWLFWTRADWDRCKVSLKTYLLLALGPYEVSILAVGNYLRKKETMLTPTTRVCKSPSAN